MTRRGRLRRRHRRRLRRRRRDLRPARWGCCRRSARGCAGSPPNPDLVHLRRGVAVPGRRASAGLAKADVVEGWIPFRRVFDVVAYGKRHVMMGATQIDRHGNQNISAIGDFDRPTRQLLGARGAPGNTVNNRTSYWVPRHSPARLRRAGRHRLRRRPGTRQGRGHRRRALQRHPPDRHQPRASSTSAAPTTRCGCGRCTRASPSTRCGRRPAATIASTATATSPRRALPTAGGAGPDPRGARPEGAALTGGPARRRRVIEQLLQHAAHRAGRRPPPGRADRHGLGRPGRGWSAAPRTPAGSASWPARR